MQSLLIANTGSQGEIPV